MMKLPKSALMFAGIGLLLAGSAAAQVLGGRVQPDLGGLGGVVGRTLGAVENTAHGAEQSLATLASDRLERLAKSVRRSNGVLELTHEGPAVRGEIIAVDPDAATLSAARAARQ